MSLKIATTFPSGPSSKTLSSNPRKKMATALLFFPHFSPLSLHRNPNPKPFSFSPLCASSSSSHRPHAAALAVATRRASVLTAPPPAPASSTAAPDDLLDISKLGISDHIVHSLARRGITQLFPIQRAVLEPAMEGRDMIGRAITGSGKTLAFGIPILDKILRNQSQQRKKRVPSALVLAPTRELARQVQREFKASAPNLSSTCVYGGIPITHQIRDLGMGMDIVVGTPGRIIDLVERGALDLSEVKFAVLDEADQMLAIGFQEAVECILSYLPSKKQCMLFSATMPSWVNELSRKFLKKPLVIDLVGDSEQKLADGISLYSVASTNPNKQNLLPTLISTYAQGGKSIIFTQTKKGAEELSRTMGSIIRSRALHGNMQQFQRDRTLAAFRNGQFNVLVATDVAARGLDIPNVDLIIHFELPNTSETFIHRSGRTGRAGNKGTAVLMFNERQRRDVRSIERDISCKFEELQGITGSFVGKTDLSDDEGESYRGYGSSSMRKPGQQNQFSDRRYGNYGGFQESRTPRYSSGDRFSSSDRSRSNHSSRRSEPRQGGYGQTRRSEYSPYEDFEDNHVSERRTNTGSSRWSSSAPTTPRRQTSRQPGSNRNAPSRSSPKDYDDLLDLFKGQY